MDAPDTEEYLLANFTKSKLWKWTVEYLKFRREALFAQECKEIRDIWVREGSLAEVNKLLKAPQLVLEFYKQQQLRESQRLAGRDSRDEPPTVNRSLYDDDF